MPGTKQFDVDEALDRAMTAFWEHGYEATSMSKLLDRMGIQKGSFYATFASKHDVYADAMQRYVNQRFAEFEAVLSGLDGRAAIEKMFAMIESECSEKGKSRGCMIVNAALELAPTDERVGDVVRRTFSNHEKWLSRLVEQGQAEGRITKNETPRELGKTLFGMIIAMRVYSRAGMPNSYAAAIRKQAIKLLDNN